MKDDDIPSCKITLIGDSGVGKSSIIGRFITGFCMKNRIISKRCLIPR